MRSRTPFGLVVVTTFCSHVALAQPPEGPAGPPLPPRDHLREALDTDGDHELDAEEIRNAATSLAKADRNGDGRIDHEEFRPPLPPRPRGEGEFRGPPPRDRGPEGRDGRREGGPPREGRPPRDGAPRGEGAGRPGAPSPERFLERALSFDADGDGTLDRGELEKFAAEFVQRMRAGPAERGIGPGGPGGERGGGFRPDDRPRRRPEGGADGDRPERPRRPE